MDLSDPKLLPLLRQMTQTARECQLAARLTGENFNVFKILDLGTAEVRTHSAFIAELLNPKGCTQVECKILMAQTGGLRLLIGYGAAK